MKKNKLFQIIDEVFNKPKDVCNSCGESSAPLLMESKVKSLLSEGLQYHLDKKTPLHETIYRYGSEKHLMLIKEARRMYSRGVIDLSEADKQLISTNLGEFGIYEGVEVPLDLPMVNEGRETPIGQGSGDREDIENEFHLLDLMGEFEEKKGKIHSFKDFSNWLESETNFNPISSSMYDKAKLTHGRNRKYLSKPGPKRNFPDSLKEKKSTTKKKKDPPIGKPKRGGSKAYYVYVRDPKTKRIKKVSFGSGGLRAKIKDSKARSAFAKRHRCSEKNDRTKASYWSCRLPRYAQALGLGSNSNTFW